MALIFVPFLQLLAGKLDFGFFNQLSIIVTIEERAIAGTAPGVEVTACGDGEGIAGAAVGS